MSYSHHTICSSFCNAVFSIIHCRYKRMCGFSFHTGTFSCRTLVPHNGGDGTLQTPYAPTSGDRSSDGDDLVIKSIEKLYRVVLKRVLKF